MYSKTQELIDKAYKNLTIFRKLIENCYEGISLLDKDGVILYINPSICQILGYEPQELIGKVGFDLTHPDDLKIAQQAFHTLLSDPSKTVRIECRIKRKDGTYKWMEVTGTNRLLDSQIQALIANFIDISQQKELERRKDEFISMSSHELKTPLATLKIYTQILRSYCKNPNEKTAIYLTKMEKQVDRLTKITTDLLDVSRLKTGKLNLRMEKFSLSQLIKNAVDDMHHITPKHKIIIDKSINKPIWADKNGIYHVLVNLVSNAIKFSPKADQVIINSYEKDESYIISVTDFGIGIAPKYLDKIFERFYQVKNQIRQSFSGLGLGLYISEAIIREHNGQIWVESEKGKGSTFYISLPKVKALIKGNGKIG